MAKVLVLGSGLMGPAIAGDLLRFGIAEEVVLTDLDPKRVEEGVGRAKRVAGAGGKKIAGKIEGKVLDLGDRKALVREMGAADVVAGAYPVAAVRAVTEASIEAGTSLCDLTGSAVGFDVFDYEKAAAKAGVTILPGCGVAPGMTNILAGQGAARLDEPEEGVLYVGGLPAHPLPPLEYRIVFSMDTVIDEYVAPCLIVRGGKIVELPALAENEELTFPEPVGKCEAFYTYGLGTLSQTGVGLGYKELGEKTVRYPGHRDKVAFLRDCGLFSLEPIVVDGVKVVPRRLTAEALTPILQRGDAADITVLRAIVKGKKAGKKTGWVFEMIDRYDPETKVTSMARTTGYTCSIIAGMLLAGHISRRGIAPLERVFADAGLFAELKSEMARRGMVLEERQLR